jgi:hypothetical protein
MSTASLEQRVANLESQVSQLLAQNGRGAQPKDWRRTIGMFTGDEVMWRICENALEYREEDRRRTRDQNANGEGDLS